MDISEKFLSRAAECTRMAQSAHDFADKATWDEMAKRWLAYAERYRQTQRPSGHRTLSVVESLWEESPWRAKPVGAIMPNKR